MSADATPAQIEPEDDDAQFYRRALRHLTNVTLDLAEMIHAEATTLSKSPDSLPALTEAAAAIDRLSRDVRRNALTAKHLDAPSRAQRRTAARKQIIRNVEDAIHRSHNTALAKERLEAELIERLESPLLDEEIDNSPVPELTTQFTRDLGISALPGAQPYKRRTPEDIVRLHARAAEPASPERLYRLVATPNATSGSGRTRPPS